MPVGPPIANTEAYVLDERLGLVGVGCPGELCLAGPHLARGYLGRPELTAERFVAHPLGGRLYRSGDKARWRPDGTLEVLGRLDDQVKLRGYRIELGEVESALRTHPAVAAAAAMVRSDQGTPRLVAYAVPQAGAGVELVALPPVPVIAARADELRVWLRERLPSYMVPSAIVVLDELPLSPNGKVDRGALPQPPHLVADDGAQASSPIEALVSEIWRDLLAVTALGPNDDLFDRGQTRSSR